MAIAGIPSLDIIPPWVLVALIVWTIPWKGLALWKSARNKQKIWFALLLIVNTLGILEILYIVFWQKKSK